MIHCIKCEIEKPDTEYYRSTIRANGTGECKTCTTARVRANRAENIERYRDFDRNRANLPHRVKARKEYAQTEQGKVATARAKEAYYYRHPTRSAAKSAVNHAIRDGKLQKPSQCECCNSKVALHGHHCDYNKPLDVMWLCDPCHKAWHKDNTPIYCDERKPA